MCGFCGVMALDGPLPPAVRDSLRAMTCAIRHRGPDGDGYFCDEVAGLGHRRLAIIDLATGEQPIGNEDDTRWIVFNGEIYNYRDLRERLVARGHIFRTHSDTETILHAYEEYGPDCVGQLEGMFAFAIYDGPARELFLARDRVGKKPLFYATLGNVLHFGSEMKALRASPSWDDTIDQAGLEGYLSLGYFLAPRTVYRHVRKLEPGHWLRVRGGRVETRRYWDVEDFDSDHRPEAAVLGELDGLLRNAVQERLMSEVPLGAFLSGGIDSGLVVSYMAEGGSPAPVTVSVGFGDETHNELDAAGLTAARFGTRHYPDVINPRLEDVLDPIVAAFDEPFADSSAIPTYYVSRSARQHVTVALSGDGGDEVFAGYDFRYVPHHLEARVRGLAPGPPGRYLLRKLGAAWPRSVRMPRPLRLGTIFDNLSNDAAGAYFTDMCLSKPPVVARLLGRAGRGNVRDTEVYESVTATYNRCPSRSAVQRAQYADLMVYLPNDPLVKVDRMSMQHSLEVRCPLLDRRVVEFAFRLPTSMKMRRLRGKHLLRTLAGRRLPPRISHLPKHGFTAPVERWITKDYRAWFEEDVLGRSARTTSLLDPGAIRWMLSELEAGRSDYSGALWSLWVFERWAARRTLGKL